jgi:tetratricopeptide (TPR) repeat protein
MTTEAPGLSELPSALADGAGVKTNASINSNTKSKFFILRLLSRLRSWRPSPALAARSIARLLRTRAVKRWRRGHLAHARAFLFIANECAPRREVDLRLAIKNNQAIIARASGRLYEAVRLQAEAGLLVEQCTDLTLIARNHQGDGITSEMIAEREPKLKEEYFDRALLSYEAASYYYEESGHQRDLASTQNCIAYLFVQLGKTDEALKYSERAINSARSVGDCGLIAECEHTQAQALLSAGRFAEAGALAARAADVFDRLGFVPLRDEALTTQMLAIARLRGSFPN